MEHGSSNDSPYVIHRQLGTIRLRYATSIQVGRHMKYFLIFLIGCGILAFLAVLTAGSVTNAGWLLAGAWAWKKYTKAYSKRRRR